MTIGSNWRWGVLTLALGSLITGACASEAEIDEDAEGKSDSASPRVNTYQAATDGTEEIGLLAILPDQRIHVECRSAALCGGAMTLDGSFRRTRSGGQRYLKITSDKGDVVKLAYRSDESAIEIRGTGGAWFELDASYLPTDPHYCAAATDCGVQDGTFEIPYECLMERCTDRCADAAVQAALMQDGAQSELEDLAAEGKDAYVVTAYDNDGRAHTRYKVDVARASAGTCTVSKVTYLDSYH